MLTGGVYEQVGIVQRRSYKMNIGGSLSILDADERVFPYPKVLQYVRFAVTFTYTGYANLSNILFRKEVRL